MGGHNDAMVNGGEWRLRMQHGEWLNHDQQIDFQGKGGGA